MKPMEARNLLLQEAKEQLGNMEFALLTMEYKSASDALLYEAYLAVHTLKGSASLFGFDLVVDFSRLVESVLLGLRTREIALDKSIIALLLSCRDYLKSVFDHYETYGYLVNNNPLLHEKLQRQLHSIIQDAESVTHTSTKGSGQSS